MSDILEIWSTLRDITKKINLDDVVEKPNTSYCESYKYESRTKKGKNRHTVFLYLHLRKNGVLVFLDTGANYSLVDSTDITLPVNYHGMHIRYKILVKPEDIKDINPKTGKYTYDDIEDLICQCYKTLNQDK